MTEYWKSIGKKFCEICKVLLFNLIIWDKNPKKINFITIKNSKTLKNKIPNKTYLFIKVIINRKIHPKFENK
jgi:hypothetical protein